MAKQSIKPLTDQQNITRLEYAYAQVASERDARHDESIRIGHERTALQHKLDDANNEILKLRKECEALRDFRVRAICAEQTVNRQCDVIQTLHTLVRLLDAANCRARQNMRSES